MIKEYILIKDLPDLKAGAIFKYTSGFYKHTSETDSWGFTIETIKNTEWFLPKLPKGWYKSKVNTYYYLTGDYQLSKTSIKYIFSQFIDENKKFYQEYNFMFSKDFINSFRPVSEKEVLDYCKPQLTFGGKEVTIIKGKTTRTTYIVCSSVQIPLAKLIQLDTLFKGLENWTDCYDNNLPLKLKEINDTPIEDTLLTIGCTTGSLKELREIIKQVGL